MKHIKYLLIISAFCCSCQETEELNLSEEKLIQVITDAHISEGAAQNLMQPIKDSILNLYYQQIFEIHQVSEAQFKADMQILARNTKLSKRIYEEVLNEIARKESGEK